MKDLVTKARLSARTHPMTADVVLSGMFFVAALVSIFAYYDEIDNADPSFDRPWWLVLVGLMLVITLPLAWRRRFPLVAAMLVVAGFLIESAVLEWPEQSITLLTGSVALYSAALYGRHRVRTWVLALCLTAILSRVVRDLFFNGAVQPFARSFFLAYNAVVLALPWALGAAVRSLREGKAQLAERAIELQREREENARQAVFAERVRIARELHDVVAHHVSVMGIQAGAARRVMDRQPERVADALASIEASSREAVGELHRLLGFLRRSGETDEIAPQPRFAELPDLIAQASQGPLAVHLAIDGEPQPIPPTLEVSVYRIIQEALTNTRKHSAGRTANVRLNYTESGLEVEVVNDGPCQAGPADAGSSGHGLIGMRERAGLHGGHVSAGPLPDGGFAVLATFPLAVGP